MAGGWTADASSFNNNTYSPLVSNYQFLQGPGYVAIVNEILHETRLIPPTDARMSRRKSAWMGDARGRWDNQTLIVDTTNFTAKSQFRGARRRAPSDRALHTSTPTPSSTNYRGRSSVVHAT